jgi:hypothetical protein
MMFPPGMFVPPCVGSWPQVADFHGASNKGELFPNRAFHPAPASCPPFFSRLPSVPETCLDRRKLDSPFDKRNSPGVTRELFCPRSNDPLLAAEVNTGAWPLPFGPLRLRSAFSRVDPESPAGIPFSFELNQAPSPSRLAAPPGPGVPRNECHQSD